jgi:hypothetical protein
MTKAEERRIWLLRLSDNLPYLTSGHLWKRLALFWAVKVAAITLCLHLCQIRA